MNRKDLKDYKYLKLRIEREMANNEEEFAKITKTTQMIDGMPKAHNKPNYSLEKFIDNTGKLFKLFNKELEKRIEIIEQLQKLENEKYYTVLYLLYIDGMELEEVASNIKYSYYKTCHFHGEALKEFDKLDKNKK